MTATAASRVKDQELMPFGLVGSASVNSFADFVPSNLNETEANEFKKQEMDEYRAWLKENNYDWEDSKLSLGYIKIGQVDLQRTFGSSATFKEIYETMSKNLNITSIKTMSNRTIECEYPYTLDSDDWQQIQMEGLKRGYESRSMR